MAEAVEFLGGVYIFDEFPFIPIDSRMSHHRVHRDKDRVSLTLESQYAVCEDKGTYLCEIIVNGSIWSKDFNVDIRSELVWVGVEAKTSEVSRCGCGLRLRHQK